MSIDEGWLCARTKHHSEEKAAANLRRQNFGVYYPKYLKRRSHAHVVDTVARPLFPNYLFVSMSNDTQRWRDICSTPYIDHLICSGDQPTLVPSNIIAALRSRENSDGFINLGLRVGDPVRIVDGVFASFFGSLESMTDDERSIVLLDLLGQKTRVELNSNQIAAA